MLHHSTKGRKWLQYPGNRGYRDHSSKATEQSICFGASAVGATSPSRRPMLEAPRSMEEDSYLLYADDADETRAQPSNQTFVGVADTLKRALM